ADGGVGPEGDLRGLRGPAMRAARGRRGDRRAGGRGARRPGLLRRARGRGRLRQAGAHLPLAHEPAGVAGAAGPGEPGHLRARCGGRAPARARRTWRRARDARPCPGRPEGADATMRFSVFHNLGAPGRIGDYATVMDEARAFALAAEEAGFWSTWYTEHHF